MIEAGALLGESIDAGSFDDRVVVATQEVIALIVGEDEDDVGLFIVAEGRLWFGEWCEGENEEREDEELFHGGATFPMQECGRLYCADLRGECKEKETDK